MTKLIVFLAAISIANLNAFAQVTSGTETLSNSDFLRIAQSNPDPHPLLRSSSSSVGVINGYTTFKPCQGEGIELPAFNYDPDYRVLSQSQINIDPGILLQVDRLSKRDSKMVWKSDNWNCDPKIFVDPLSVNTRNSFYLPKTVTWGANSLFQAPCVNDWFQLAHPEFIPDGFKLDK